MNPLRLDSIIHTNTVRLCLCQGHSADVFNLLRPKTGRLRRCPEGKNKPRDISRLFPVHWNGGVASLFAKIASDCFDGQGPGRPLPLAGDEGLHRQSLPGQGADTEDYSLPL